MSRWTLFWIPMLLVGLHAPAAYPADAGVAAKRLVITDLTQKNGRARISYQVRRDAGIYVGRYSAAGATNSSGLWVGRLVSYDRIDGFWTATGRWDFRRKFE